MSASGVKLSQPTWLGVVGSGAEAPGRAGKVESGGEGADFTEILKTALEKVNTALLESDAAAKRLATGEAANLHEVVLATEQANLALQFAVAIRNKVLEAYNELMRMPV
ncbi:MAG: flagellar hook-basal body complex protein FliE [Betaproteobacteria bacterium]